MTTRSLVGPGRGQCVWALLLYPSSQEARSKTMGFDEGVILQHPAWKEGAGRSLQATRAARQPGSRLWSFDAPGFQPAVRGAALGATRVAGGHPLPASARGSQPRGGAGQRPAHRHRREAAAHEPEQQLALRQARAVPGLAQRRAGSGGRLGRVGGAEAGPIAFGPASAEATEFHLVQLARAAARDLRRALRFGLRARSQVFVEVGFSKGSVAKALDHFGDHSSLWVSGSFCDLSTVRRLLVGWVGSRAERGLCVSFPRCCDSGCLDSASDTLAAAVGQLAMLAFRACALGCPVLVLAPLSGASPQLQAFLEEWLRLPATWSCTVSPCRHDPRWPNEDLRVLTAHAGPACLEASPCPHSPAILRGSSPFLSLGPALACALASHLRAACDRLQVHHLSRLVC